MSPSRRWAPYHLRLALVLAIYRQESDYKPTLADGSLRLSESGATIVLPGEHGSAAAAPGYPGRGHDEEDAAELVGVFEGYGYMADWCRNDDLDFEVTIFVNAEAGQFDAWDHPRHNALLALATLRTSLPNSKGQEAE